MLIKAPRKTRNQVLTVYDAVSLRNGSFQCSGKGSIANSGRSEGIKRQALKLGGSFSLHCLLLSEDELADPQSSLRGNRKPFACIKPSTKVESHESRQSTTQTVPGNEDFPIFWDTRNCFANQRLQPLRYGVQGFSEACMNQRLVICDWISLISTSPWCLHNVHVRHEILDIRLNCSTEGKDEMLLCLVPPQPCLGTSVVVRDKAKEVVAVGH
mmetsp:Transcript_117135/g.303887  ORF Transcript_117135/g.303887 Transcript_117135/m.303887 type:complete len:213 (-) Transcript_117135:1372-2010(-)